MEKCYTISMFCINFVNFRFFYWFLNNFFAFYFLSLISRNRVKYSTYHWQESHKFTFVLKYVRLPYMTPHNLHWKYFSIAIIRYTFYWYVNKQNILVTSTKMRRYKHVIVPNGEKLSEEQLNHLPITTTDKRAK